MQIGEVTYLLVRYQSGGPKKSVYHLTIQSEGASQPELVLSRFPVLVSETLTRRTIHKEEENTNLVSL